MTDAPQDPGLACGHCGSTPAVAVNFHAHRGIILFMRSSAVAGPFCRDCGLATFRDLTAKTLVQGWWGLFSVFVTLAVLMSNVRSRWRLRGLGTPVRPSAGSFKTKMNPGSPLFRRPQIAGPLLPIAVAWLLASASWSQGANPDADDVPSTDSHVGECVRSVMNDLTGAASNDFHIIMFVPCTGTNEGRIVSVIHTNALCPNGTSTGVSFVELGIASRDSRTTTTSYCYAPS